MKKKPCVESQQPKEKQYYTVKLFVDSFLSPPYRHTLWWCTWRVTKSVCAWVCAHARFRLVLFFFLSFWLLFRELKRRRRRDCCIVLLWNLLLPTINNNFNVNKFYRFALFAVSSFAINIFFNSFTHIKYRIHISFFSLFY